MNTSGAINMIKSRSKLFAEFESLIKNELSSKLKEIAEQQRSVGIGNTPIARFGALIRAIRNYKEISMDVFSHGSSISPVILESIEMGGADYNTIETHIINLAKGLGIRSDLLQLILIKMAFDRPDESYEDKPEIFISDSIDNSCSI
jgi:hypothetical protein